MSANNTVAVYLDLNESNVKKRVTSDQFGLFVAHEWKRLIDPYTPHDSGNLQSNVTIRPFEIEYNSRYAHYIYTGEVYVDPLYNVGGFYSEEIGWWSRPGVQKVPSGRSFKHFNTNTNPKATDHWDSVAVESGQLDKLERTIESALKSGIY